MSNKLRAFSFDVLASRSQKLIINVTTNINTISVKNSHFTITVTKKHRISMAPGPGSKYLPELTAAEREHVENMAMMAWYMQFNNSTSNFHFWIKDRGGNKNAT